MNSTTAYTPCPTCRNGLLKPYGWLALNDGRYRQKFACDNCGVIWVQFYLDDKDENIPKHWGKYFMWW